MLKIVPAPISIPFSRHLHPCRCCFFAVRTSCFMHGIPQNGGALGNGGLSGTAVFSTTSTFTGGNSLKKGKSSSTGNQIPTKKKFRIHYQNIITGAAAFAYSFTLQAGQALASDQGQASDMWGKAETIMQDVYGKILGISTIAAIVTASVALLLMNFSKSGKTVDESRAWLKRIAISWVVLNGLGFILAYVTPFFSDGQWNG